jgi:hypothetical protein
MINLNNYQICTTCEICKTTRCFKKDYQTCIVCMNLLKKQGDLQRKVEKEKVYTVNLPNRKTASFQLE